MVKRVLQSTADAIMLKLVVQKKLKPLVLQSTLLAQQSIRRRRRRRRRKQKPKKNHVEKSQKMGRPPPRDQEHLDKCSNQVL